MKVVAVKYPMEAWITLFCAKVLEYGMKFLAPLDIIQVCAISYLEEDIFLLGRDIFFYLIICISG